MFWLGRASQQEQKQDAEEMSSSTRAPQQEPTREAAGMEQKQAGTQKECKHVRRGRRQRQTEPGQECKKNGQQCRSIRAETKEAEPGTQQELSRAVAGPQQI